MRIFKELEGGGFKEDSKKNIERRRRRRRRRETDREREREGGRRGKIVKPIYNVLYKLSKLILNNIFSSIRVLQLKIVIKVIMNVYEKYIVQPISHIIRTSSMIHYLGIKHGIPAATNHFLVQPTLFVLFKVRHRENPLG